MIHVQVPEPVLTESFDRETIHRGRVYAESGHVVSLHVGQEPGGVTLSGTVTRTRSSPYDVDVFVEDDYGRMAVYTDCTCPVEIECKHAVALIWRRTLRQADQADRAGRSCRRGGPPCSTVR